MSTRTARTTLLLTSLLAAVLLVPGAAADAQETGGIYPCDGGYYIDLGWLVTECLPGLGFTGTQPCAGPYGPGTSVWVNGQELFCIY